MHVLSKCSRLAADSSRFNNSQIVSKHQNKHPKKKNYINDAFFRGKQHKNVS